MLLAEPNPELLDLTAEQLRGEGFRVAALSQPHAAAALCSAFAPNVVVVSARAPHLEGLTLGRRMARACRGTLPILYLLDAPDPELRRLCLLRGEAADVLSRPFDPRELALKIRALSRLREAITAQSRQLAAEELLQDEQSGVHSRSFLRGVLAHELRRGERHGESCSLLLVGLRSFPEVKKRFGRELFERLLVYTALVIRRSVRESDLVGRLGEATFGVLLPRARQEDVRGIRRRLMARFGGARFQLGLKVYRPAVAVGASSFPEIVGGADAMVAAAELELKRARLGQSPHPMRVSG